MGVSNGQDATAATFNSAFPSKNADDVIPSKWNLENIDSESGENIVNLQKAVNESLSKNYPTQAVSSGGEIDIDLVKGVQNRLLESSSGVEALSLTPFGNIGGWKNGTEVRIFGTSDTNRPTIIHNDNDYGAILNGDANLRRFDSVSLVWFESLLRWVELTRNF